MQDKDELGLELMRCYHRLRTATRASERESIRRELAHELLEQHDWSGRTTHFGWEISYRPSARMRELLSELEALERPPRFNASAESPSD